MKLLSALVNAAAAEALLTNFTAQESEICNVAKCRELIDDPLSASSSSGIMRCLSQAPSSCRFLATYKVPRVSLCKRIVAESDIAKASHVYDLHPLRPYVPGKIISMEGDVTITFDDTLTAGNCSYGYTFIDATSAADEGCQKTIATEGTDWSAVADEKDRITLELTTDMFENLSLMDADLKFDLFSPYGCASAVSQAFVQATYTVMYSGSDAEQTSRRKNEITQPSHTELPRQESEQDPLVAILETTEEGHHGGSTLSVAIADNSTNVEVVFSTEINESTETTTGQTSEDASEVGFVKTMDLQSALVVEVLPSSRRRQSHSLRSVRY